MTGVREFKFETNGRTPHSPCEPERTPYRPHACARLREPYQDVAR